MEALNPKDFPASARIRSKHSGNHYIVVEPDKNGMALLLNEATGRNEPWNAYNNPHFYDAPIVSQSTLFPAVQPTLF